MLRGGGRQDQKLKSGKVYQILRIWTKKRSKPNGQRERVCWAHPEAGVRASRRVTHERGHTTVSWGEPAYSLPCFKFVCVWLWGRGVAVKWSQIHRRHEDISADRDAQLLRECNSAPSGRASSCCNEFILFIPTSQPVSDHCLEQGRVSGGEIVTNKNEAKLSHSITNETYTIIMSVRGGIKTRSQTITGRLSVVYHAEHSKGSWPADFIFSPFSEILLHIRNSLT